jgi:hypothetical protein
MIPHLAVRIPYRPWSLSPDAERTTPHVSVTATGVRGLDVEVYVFLFTTCSRSILCSVRTEAYLSNDYLLNCWFLKFYHWSGSAPDSEAYKENARDLK